MHQELRSVWFWISLAVLALLCVFLVYPVARIFLASLGGPAGGGSGWSIIASDIRYQRAIANTLLLGGAVTAVSLAIGVPLA